MSLSISARGYGRFTSLVEDGIIQMPKLKQTRISLERLFAHLRGENIRHLGEVKRLYFEANGSFSLVKNESPAPGLAVIPASDREFLDEQPQAGVNVCRTCGNRQSSSASRPGTAPPFKNTPAWARDNRSGTPIRDNGATAHHQDNILVRRENGPGAQRHDAPPRQDAVSAPERDEPVICENCKDSEWVPAIR
jgi:hypothetical protein